MGQRMQYIISFTDSKTKEKEMVVVYNSWSYGVGAINRTRKFVESINKIAEGIKEYKKENRDYYASSIELVEKLPELVNNFELPYIDGNIIDYKSISRYLGEETSGFFKEKKLRDVFPRLDNNNGFVFLDFDENFENIKYCIVGGSEDVDGFPELDFYEYLELFNAENDVEELKKDKDFQDIMKVLEKVEYVDLEYWNKIYQKLHERFKEKNESNNN